MADNATVDPVIVGGARAVVYGGLYARSLRGLPIGPAYVRHGAWPLSVVEKGGFRISHTISAEEKGGLHEISCQYAGDLP